MDFNFNIADEPQAEFVFSLSKSCGGSATWVCNGGSWVQTNNGCAGDCVDPQKTCTPDIVSGFCNEFATTTSGCSCV